MPKDLQIAWNTNEFATQKGYISIKDKILIYTHESEDTFQIVKIPEDPKLNFEKISVRKPVIYLYSPKGREMSVDLRLSIPQED